MRKFLSLFRALPAGAQIGIALVPVLIAIGAWLNARDERLRLEGEYRAEVRAVTARADSMLQVERDSAAVRTRRDSLRIAAVTDSLASEKRRAASLRAVAAQSGRAADSVMVLLEHAQTAVDSLPLAIEALRERSAEAQAQAQAADRERAGREIAERGLAALQGRIDELAQQHQGDVALIKDLREKLNTPAAVQKKPGLFTRAFHVARDVAAVVGVAAIVVVASGGGG